MEYFFYCRDKADTAALRKQFVQVHWSFMDRYADKMIARGPTLAEDGVTQTGSMHIVNLPDAAAARVFAYEEPFFREGVFAEAMIRRWRNALGRTMWEFHGDPEHNQRFLIIGHGKPGVSQARGSLLDEHRDYLLQPDHAPHFIARGPLLSDDGAAWVGSAMLVEFPSREAVETMLASEPYNRAGLYQRIEIHNWRFGGRH